ncbi:hypothetical protein BKA82DRAFT_4346548 [Pisolithus tinctorius]|nr:hypothetical protein BKA82DRAFT_4346548 [Pisolithus tinctorius]
MILKDSHLPSDVYDFDLLFQPNTGIDLPCVFREGRYPSVNDDIDDDEPTVPAPCSTNVPCLPWPADEQSLMTVDHDIEVPATAVEDSLEILLEEALDGVVGDDLQDGGDHLGGDAFDESVDQDNDDMPSPNHPPKGPGISPNDYLWCEKKWAHKSTICHVVTSPNFTAKSHDCLLHVHGFSPVNKNNSGMQSGNLLRGDKFVVRDLFVTLIHTQAKVMAIALTHCTSISHNGSLHGDLNLATLTSSRGNVKLGGNILTLTPASTESLDNILELLWIWTGSFASIPSPVPGTATTTKHVASISVSGHLVKMANPLVVKALSYLLPENCEHINSRDSTWALTHDALEVATSTMWKRIVDLGMPLMNIPSLSGESPSFPYKASDGTSTLICVSGTEQLNASRAIWHYNMEAHLEYQHPEYSHPGKPHGLPLPHNVYDSMVLTPSEEKKAQVPLCPAFTNILEKDKASAKVHTQSQKQKENVAVSGILSKKARLV